MAEVITMSVTTGEGPGHLRVTVARKEMEKIG